MNRLVSEYGFNEVVEYGPGDNVLFWAPGKKLQVPDHLKRAVQAGIMHSLYEDPTFRICVKEWSEFSITEFLQPDPSDEEIQAEFEDYRSKLLETYRPL